MSEDEQKKTMDEAMAAANSNASATDADGKTIDAEIMDADFTEVDDADNKRAKG